MFVLMLSIHLHENEVPPPPPDAVTPPSDFSDSYPSARIDPDPTNIIHHSDAIVISTSPHGSFDLEKQATPSSNGYDISPSTEPCASNHQLEPSDVVNSSGKACGPLFTDPIPSTSDDLKKQDNPLSPTSSPTSQLSVSPRDSPSQRRLLLVTPPPATVVTPKMKSRSNTRRILNRSDYPTTKRLASNDLRHRLVNGAVPSDRPDCDAGADSRKCYLTSRNELLVRMKKVCEDTDETLSSNPVSPPIVADCRRVTFKDSTQQSSPIVVPSLSPPSQSDAASSGRSENTKFALKVLRETFHLQPPASPPSRVCSTAGCVQSTSVKSPVNEIVNETDSPILFDDPPSTSSRASSPVAPPLPVTDQIRPGRSLYNPVTHRRVVGPVVSGTVSDLINHIRNASPRNVVNPDEIDVDDSDNANIPPTLPDVDLAADNDIPSAQPRLPRQPDIAAEPPAPNPPPADNEDPSDLDSSGDLLLQDADLVKLTEFRGKWIDTFNSEHSWNEFTDLCVQFASDAREMAQYLNRPKNVKPTVPSDPPPPPPPPARRPPHDRGFRRFNPVEARRIQALYRHSRKRAARQLLNDATVSYGGSKADAETYFEEVFSENIDTLESVRLVSSSMMQRCLTAVPKLMLKPISKRCSVKNNAMLTCSAKPSVLMYQMLLMT